MKIYLAGPMSGHTPETLFQQIDMVLDRSLV
jgi:hypothetical protein